MSLMCVEWLTEKQPATLPKSCSKMWVFCHCLVDGVLYHSRSYKGVVALNDFTIKFQELEGSKSHGSVHIYFKVQEKCTKANM